ncbi:MAG: CtsR family transcriptional regulator [Clostridiales bacterium]|nr:CtsR family transcriptional regulator [Clostridiales bacterium]
MLISDYIAQIIEEMLDAGDGCAEVRRNDLALKVGCVPSQINYVITSRFTPERGYIIESRRGGGGYIRIVRKQMHKNDYLMHFFCAIGDSIEEDEANAYLLNLLGANIITERESKIISRAISSGSLAKAPPSQRGAIRADILRHIILDLIN